MRTLARQFSNYLFQRKPGNEGTTKFSFFPPRRDDLSIEEDVERKIGWFLKIISAGTIAAVGYQFFPYLGENVMQQSVSLLHVRDPLFKRMGASRLCRFAIDDERRMRIVEMGGARGLIKMLEGAPDDKTRKEALKALHALSQSDQVAEALHQAGAVSAIRSTPDSSEDSDVMNYKSSLLKKFQDVNYDATS